MAGKKKHWTQTVRGRAHMREMGHRRSELRKEARKLQQGNSDGQVSSFHAAFLLGKVETIIEYYAASQGVPAAPLAKELAGLLRHSQSG